MTNLRKLIEAVEAGSIARSDLDAFIPVLGLSFNANNALDAYRGSLDAAKALHEALLPGWIFDVTNGSAFVCPEEYLSFDPAPESVAQFSGEADLPARAWLLAILRAYEAQQ